MNTFFGSESDDCILKSEKACSLVHPSPQLTNTRRTKSFKEYKSCEPSTRHPGDGAGAGGRRFTPHTCPFTGYTVDSHPSPGPVTLVWVYVSLGCVLLDPPSPNHRPSLHGRDDKD
eukprot:489808-Prorocentrum_minimum.AAC.4